MNLFWAAILLLVGLTILVKGADWLVDSAVAIAKHFGMSPLIIGLTIVAMGTSAPEVAASVVFSLSNMADAAVGNVYGSNVANLAFVGGLCALIRPISITRSAQVRDIPIMMLVIVVLYGILSNLFVGRWESLAMLLFFTGIIFYMIRSERKFLQSDKQVIQGIESHVEQIAQHSPKRIWGYGLFLLLGLGFLSGGAKLTELSAVFLGRSVGLSDGVIGSTIIAIGTSLPELITCLVAAFKGHDDLSIGNLVGSNIFNTMLVIGTAGLVKPLLISERMVGTDYIFMAGVSIVFVILAFLFKKINRLSGVILLLLYIFYLVYLFAINH
jgi:cation:H+ antiporter